MQYYYFCLDRKTRSKVLGNMLKAMLYTVRKGRDSNHFSARAPFPFQLYQDPFSDFILLLEANVTFPKLTFVRMNKNGWTRHKYICE